MINSIDLVKCRWCHSTAGLCVGGAVAQDLENVRGYFLRSIVTVWWDRLGYGANRASDNIRRLIVQDRMLGRGGRVNALRIRGPAYALLLSHQRLGEFKLKGMILKRRSEILSASIRN